VMAMKQGAGQEGDAAVRLAALEAKQARSDAEGLVAMALTEGKITPAQKDWAIDYAAKDAEAFKVFVAKAPKVVPLGRGQEGHVPEGGGLDETQVQVNRMLGLKEEIFRKHNREEAGA